MELKDFISESLIQIVEGTVQAQKYFDKKIERANVLQKHWVNFYPSVDIMGRDEHEQPIHCIKFDVSVELSENSDNEGKAGINVFAAKFSGNTASNKSDTRQTNISFTLPLSLPMRENNKNKK